MGGKTRKIGGKTRKMGGKTRKIGGKHEKLGENVFLRLLVTLWFLIIYNLNFSLSKILYNYFRELLEFSQNRKSLLRPWGEGISFFYFIYFLEKLWWTQKKSVPLHVKLKNRKENSYENSKWKGLGRGVRCGAPCRRDFEEREGCNACNRHPRGVGRWWLQHRRSMCDGLFWVSWFCEWK